MNPDIRIATDEEFQKSAKFIGKHSVALLLEAPDGGAPNLVGSGSLIAFDEKHFILTATHVWNRLKQHSKILYSLADDITQHAVMHKMYLRAVSLPWSKADLSEDTEDVTLIELDPRTVGSLNGRRSFHHIVNEKPINDADIAGVYLIMGAPGVLRSAKGDVLTFALNGTQVIPEREYGVDFHVVKPWQIPEEAIKDWRGVSGGGLWEVAFSPDSDYRLRLFGVCFMQHEVNGDMQILCVGQSSIQKIMNLWRETVKKP